MSGIIGSTEYVSNRQFQLLEAKPGLPCVFDPETDLRHYLRGPFKHSYPLKLTTRATDGTGHQLTTVMLTRIEVAACIGMLPYRQQLILRMHYEDGLDQRDMVRLLEVSERTVRGELAAAIASLTARIFSEKHTTN